jgi:hypothetical protein
MINCNLANSLPQRGRWRGADGSATDEEVAIKIYFTGVVWILFCGIRILLHRNKDHKRREALARATSSSTACAVPLPRWGRLKRPTNQNLKLLQIDIEKGYIV